MNKEKMKKLIEKIDTNPQDLSYEDFPLDAFTAGDLEEILEQVIPYHVDDEFGGQRTFEFSVKGGFSVMISADIRYEKLREIEIRKKFGLPFFRASYEEQGLSSVSNFCIPENPNNNFNIDKMEIPLKAPTIEEAKDFFKKSGLAYAETRNYENGVEFARKIKGSKSFSERSPQASFNYIGGNEYPRTVVIEQPTIYAVKGHEFHDGRSHRGRYGEDGELTEVSDKLLPRIRHKFKGGKCLGTNFKGGRHLGTDTEDCGELELGTDKYGNQLPEELKETIFGNPKKYLQVPVVEGHQRDYFSVIPLVDRHNNAKQEMKDNIGNLLSNLEEKQNPNPAQTKKYE